jgi:hypothetical protein
MHLEHDRHRLLLQLLRLAPESLGIPKLRDTEETSMYIGGGVVTLIVIIVILLLLHVI